MLDWTELPLLLGALALFLLSTQQRAMRLRLAIIVAGSALLFLCAVEALDLNNYGLLNALGDLWAHLTDPADSVIGIAFARDFGVIARHIAPLTQMLVVVAAAIGVLCVVALTPGERVEQAVRTSVTALLGVMTGAALAFGLVVLGMGGPVKQRVYVARMIPEDNAHRGDDLVHDGDTIWIGDVSIRLAGIDAPELRQICLGGEACGEVAKEELRKFVSGRLLECETLPPHADGGLPPESFGRPLANCFIRDGDHAGASIADYMRENGFAIGFENHKEVMPPTGTYLASRCMLLPRLWRTDSGERLAFERNDLGDINRAHLLPACSASSDNPR